MDNDIKIRAYAGSDEEQVLQVFDSNTPEFFSEEERPGFISYLRHEIEHYFVIVRDDIIVGAGGVNLEDDGRTGIISWGMVHRDDHGQSLGSKLLRHRIAFLKNRQVDRITVRTSQLTAGFFSKHGFVLLEVVPDYWAEGFDMYKMEFRGK